MTLFLFCAVVIVVAMVAFAFWVYFEAIVRLKEQMQLVMAQWDTAFMVNAELSKRLGFAESGGAAAMVELMRLTDVWTKMHDANTERITKLAANQLATQQWMDRQDAKVTALWTGMESRLTELAAKIHDHETAINGLIADLENRGQLVARIDAIESLLDDLRKDFAESKRPPVAQPRGWRQTRHELEEAQRGVLPEVGR